MSAELHDCANPACSQQIRVHTPDREQALTLDFTEATNEVVFTMQAYVCSQECRDAVAREVESL